MVASTLAVGFVVTGCGSSSAPEAADGLSASEVAARYGYDVASVTLPPVYALVPERGDPRDSYARNLLLVQCLEGVVAAQALPPSADPGFDPRTKQRVFTEEIAAQWGYQLPAAGPRWYVVSPELMTPAIDEQMRQCGERTGERLGVPPERALNAIESAGWDALEASDEVAAAAEEWRTCMAPAGVIDLPEKPSDMPSPSVHPAAGQDVPSGSIVPSAMERQIAVLDARCRTTADVNGAELRVRAEAELTAIGRDIEGFESARREYQEYDKKIDQVIEELG